MKIHVAPDAFYSRFFRALLEFDLDEKSRILITSALRESNVSVFCIFEERSDIAALPVSAAGPNFGAAGAGVRFRWTGSPLRARSLKFALCQQLRINDAELTENEGGIGMAGSQIGHSSQLDDPRIDRHKQHELVDIIVLCVCAVVGGAEGSEAIEELGKAKLAWLRNYLPLANGIPAHDTIARVISRLSSKGLQECFLRMPHLLPPTPGNSTAFGPLGLRPAQDTTERSSDSLSQGVDAPIPTSCRWNDARQMTEG